VTIDLTSITALDVHVHPSTEENRTSWGHLQEATERYFRTEVPVRTVDEMAAEMEADGVAAVLLAWDAQTHSGLPPVTNDHVASCVAAHPERFIGFASVDPWKGNWAIGELRRAVGELGLVGLKLHPSAQAFEPNDRRFYPLWQTAGELGIPVLFHTGTTGLGAGLAGGGGVKLRMSDPMLLDDVAADFPDLQIVGAHPSWPWQDQMLAITTHKANVWIDLSGWSPRKWSPALTQAVLGPLQDRCLFGTDYPFLRFPKWLEAFRSHEPSAEVERKVLLGNAARLLGLT
jgi:predicted TIM-barrel fold metal-dependent hydrolase